MRPIEVVLARVERLPNLGAKGWKAVCPLATGDRQDKKDHVLKITVNTRGAVGLFCHQGCQTEHVLSAVGLRLSDLYPPRQTGHGRRGPAMSEEVRLRRAGLNDDQVAAVLARARKRAGG